MSYNYKLSSEENFKAGQKEMAERILRICMDEELSDGDILLTIVSEVLNVPGVKQ